MVRIVNGNIVEDDDRSNLAAANGASGNVAPGGFLETMAQPVEIYGYQTVRVTDSRTLQSSASSSRPHLASAPKWTFLLPLALLHLLIICHLMLW